MAVYAATYDSKSSYITNGKRYRVERDDGRGLFNIRSNRGTMLTCLWEGCAHLGTRGNWTRIEEEEQVTLLPGDYVSTEGMTEDQYHAVARAFMAAGAKDMGDSEYGRLGGASKNLGWDSRDDELWNSAILPAGFTGRHLTPAQVIGAVNAGNQQEKDNMEHKAGDRFVATADSRFFSEGSTVRFTGEYGCFGNPKMELVSGECSLNNGPGGTPGAIETFDRFEKINDTDTLTQALLDAAEHDEKAKHHAAEHDRLMQRARDMLPDGWRLVRDGEPEADMADPANWRIGDRVKCVADPASGNSNFADGDFEVGGIYTVHETDGSDCYGYLDESGADFYEMNRFFRFHFRPTT